LELLCALLEEMGVKATFFAESRTLREIAASARCLEAQEVASHAVEHEDLTGGKTGVRLDDQELRRVLMQGKEDIEDIIGRAPSGFRAPYQNVDARVLDAVRDCGFLYDSSLTMPINDGALHPYRLENGLWEFPVAESRDRDGKRIVSYLWPMHEGRRRPQDYQEMSDSLQEGVLVIATHTWHVVESFRNGPMDDADVSKNLADIRSVLEHALDSGMRASTLGSLLNAGR
jgi:peptidoglycan/xylan/chitin deacetylase (PgdA/CDA1 family)